LLANANNLPFEEGTFDLITFMIILTNLDNQKQSSMLECTRVLKKGGKMILSTYSDTAFEERMKIYKIINVPIKKIENTKVIFDETVGANVSEQFSLEELKNLGNDAGLSLIEFQ
jgi:ubiquinone/menaquinone biosynthesis C-methylase UbiE